MKSAELYAVIHQAIADNGVLAVADLQESDYNRAIAVHCAKNSDGNLSHITLEFVGLRARFLTCILFDGSGDYGTGMHEVSMPKVKLQTYPRAVVTLAVLDYLTSNGFIDAPFEFFVEKVQSTVGPGMHRILPAYLHTKHVAAVLIEYRRNGSRGFLDLSAPN